VRRYKNLAVREPVAVLLVRDTGFNKGRITEQCDMPVKIVDDYTVYQQCKRSHGK
jgi:hypothetical protein